MTGHCDHVGHDWVDEGDGVFVCGVCEVPDERRVAARERLEKAASWLLCCHDDMVAGHPVRGLDEAWEGLRCALRVVEKGA